LSGELLAGLGGGVLVLLVRILEIGVLLLLVVGRASLSEVEEPLTSSVAHVEEILSIGRDVGVLLQACLEVELG
jgi:hypothetical protein